MTTLRHELRMALLTPQALLLLGVWLLFVGAFFTVELFAFEQAEQRALALDDPSMLAMLDVNDLLLASVYNNLTIVLMFLAPLLALRSWSDGPARMWLLSRATSTGAFVAARCTAQAIGVIALVTATMVLPVVLAAFGKPATDAGAVIDVGQTLTSVMVVCAAGVSFSLLSASIIAAVEQPLGGALISFIVLIALWVLPSASGLLGPHLSSVVSALSPATHLERGLRGVVHIGDVVYWLALCGGCVMALTAFVEERRR